ncbi:bacteriohemerythrin [mine drainage metagenome]|uniref:Bacteriohemerythrin n=1 Tax=mine drainage metagenome TaxID=410659 RepID=A0A1J5SE36_9ZZZZ
MLNAPSSALDPEDIVIRWSGDLSVGIPSLDEDHKILVDLLNSTLVACYAGFGDEHVALILDELFRYTEIHFDREIALLSVSGYPGWERHKHEHDQLFARLQSIARQARSEAPQGLSREVLVFLRGWLFDHILRHDRQYAEHLRQA